MVKKISSGLFIVFIISLLPLLNLFNNGLPVTHDGLDHVVRIANFYQSLTDGELVPRWAGNLNWGYGHPILMFLYPLPSYSASFFHLLGFSLVDSFKLVLAVSYVLSGIFMYLWLKEFLEKNSAILGSVLYLFAPYRFIDLYVRGALGEHVAFVFLPLILLALIKLNRNKTTNHVRNLYIHVIFVAISFAFLMLSHNAISLLFMPFILFYVLYLFYEHRSRLKLFVSGFSLILGFLFSAFFWFPAFVEGKYTLRDIVTSGVYQDRFVDITQLLYGPWDYGGTGVFTVQIGITHIFLVLLGIFLFLRLFKRDPKQRILFMGTLVFLIISIFLMLEQARPIYENITTLQKLQFPWRFLTIVVFGTSLIGAFIISKLKFMNKNLITYILIIVTIVLTVNYWHAKEYRKIDNNFFEKIYAGTTDTGESSPIWSIRFMEKTPKDTIEIIEGKGQIVKLPRLSTNHEYVIDAKEKIRIRENTLYFPGWKIYDNNQLVTAVEFQDPKNRGLMTFYMGPGIHNVIVKFEDTKVRKISNYVTLLSIFGVFFIPLIFYLFPKKRINKLQW